jgi:hypothetical protein
MTMKLKDAIKEIKKVHKAPEFYPPFQTYQEGCLVLQEAVDGLEYEINKKSPPATPYQVKMAAIQLAALAVGFLVDLVE